MPELVLADDEPGDAIMSIPRLSLDDLGDEDEAIIAIGSSRTRRAVSERLRCKAGVLVAPNAIVGSDVEYGEGAVFCPFAMATVAVRIGRHFQCNMYSYVAHDCIIGDYVTFAPRVSCNGNVHIEDDVFIGSGAVIRHGRPGNPIVIGAGATVGMGAIVTKSVPAGAVVVGNPARALLRA